MPPLHDMSVLSAFLSLGGRLPGFAQRRLDDLIAKEKEGALTSDERQELAEALEYLDEKSIELMAYVADAAKNAPGNGEDAPAGPGVSRRLCGAGIFRPG